MNFELKLCAEWDLITRTKSVLCRQFLTEVILKMKRLFILSAIGAAMLMILFPSRAATNLNSSRSNIYRMVYPADLVSQAQAAAMLAELDKLGASNEATLKRWLAANFKKFGIQETRVKKVSIFLEQQVNCAAAVEACKGKWKGPALNARTEPNAVCFCYEPVTSLTQVGRVNRASPVLILLLSDPTQEPDALAVNLNSSKSN